jgi:hypothetical protein
MIAMEPNLSSPDQFLPYVNGTTGCSLTSCANCCGEGSKRHYIIFDGDVDVDPEWVENLNRCVSGLGSFATVT